MTSNASDCIIILALIGILLVPVALVILFASDSPPVITPAPTATPTWTDTPKPTLPTLTISPTFTAVNIPSTPDPTPTEEIGCIPGSYGTVLTDTILYSTSALDPDYRAFYATSHHAIAHMELATVQAGEQVIFLYDRTDTARMVVTADDPLRVGWIPVNVLSEECR